jgi:hypothetical protein
MDNNTAIKPAEMRPGFRLNSLGRHLLITTSIGPLISAFFNQIRSGAKQKMATP